MKQINLEQILLVIVCLIVTVNSYAQERKHCSQKITPHIEAPRQGEDGELYHTDSLKRSVRMIFEKGFNDTITIMLNKKIVFDSLVATGPGFHNRRERIDIDYSKVRKPCIWLPGGIGIRLKRNDTFN
jgi:hypothetical protein